MKHKIIISVLITYIITRETGWYTLPQALYLAAAGGVIAGVIWYGITKDPASWRLRSPQNKTKKLNTLSISGMEEKDNEKI